MTDPVWRSNFALLEGLGLSFDLQVFPSQLVQAAELASDFPGVRIILDHAGMPIGRDAESMSQWRAGLMAVARNDNVSVKVSALGTNDHRWTTESIRPIVRETIEIFGPHRTMFGSNFPVDGLYSTFARLYEAFDEITGDLPDSARTALFSGTAMSVYRLEGARGALLP
jgi:predicted TIM-barrel fold metal-dependent hydrolase